MINDIKISVIVPAYNVEKWLPRCIESILRQTHDNLEIIIINDGSTDNTGNVIEQYADKDNRIIPVYQNNMGLIEVRERGIMLASGQYVGFVDGDDEIEPDMFERLLSNALEYDAEISQCGILYCFYDGRRKPMHGTGNILVLDRNAGYRELMQGVRMEPSLCNKLYKRELLFESCPDKTIINNEDLLRNSVLFTRARKTVFDDFCGYHYWRRAESMSNNSKTIGNAVNILKSRKTVLDTATEDLFEYALECYVSGRIGAYNGIIADKTEDGKALRKHVKKELYKYKSSILKKNRKVWYKICAILYCPVIYDVAYTIHMKKVYAKIRKQVEEINRQNGGNPS